MPSAVVYVSILLETLNVTGPIFILVMVGLCLKRFGMIDDHFVQVSSKVVFSLCLPVLLATTIVSLDFSQTFSASSFTFGILATLVTFSLSWLFALGVTPRGDRGVVIQASFRSNLGVIGLALCANAYGSEGLALASLFMAALTFLYNVLSVLVLSFYLAEGRIQPIRLITDIVKNPLIVAIVLASVVAAIGVPVPGVLISAGEYLGSMALPLALLGTGAGLSLRALRESSAATALVLFLKTMLLPAIAAGLGYFWGLTTVELGVIFLLFVAPTASASYAMVKAMGGNDVLAANLITATTIVSIFTASLGLFILRAYGLA